MTEMLSPQNNAEPVKSARGDENLIKWNLDMSVTVSNVKSSKLLHKVRIVAFFVLAVIFAVALAQLKRELQALQVQVHCVNVNILMLMSKYDKFNRGLNRLRRPTQYYDSIEPIKAIVRKFADVSEAYRSDRIFDMTSLPSSSDRVIHPVSLRPTNRQKDATEKGSSVVSNDVATSSVKSRSDLHVDPEKNRTFLRSARAILTFETQNSTAKGHGRDYGDGLSVWRESRAGRLRRDERRGKKWQQNRRRPKRSRRRLDPLVVTFVGAIPEQHVTDTVYIGPWVESNKSNTQYSLTKFHLVEDKMSIEVTASGLYMIGVQIFYFGELTNYSYWVLLNSEGVSTTQKLIKCATASSSMLAEVSCYTSVVTYLQKGDRLRIQQQERNRLINMREGYSHIQLVLLASNAHRRRST